MNGHSMRVLALALCAPLAFCACTSGGPSGGAGGTGGGDGGGAQSANAQACQALRSGPFAPVTGRATYTFSDPGPAVSNDRKAYRVTLPSPSNVGHVSFKVPAAAEYVVFASRPLPIAVFTWDGTILNPKTLASSVSECAEVKTRLSFDLMTDTRAHVIKLGPDSGGAVDLALAAGP
jgi:hypothetical protein